MLMSPIQSHHLDEAGTTPPWWSQALDAELATISLPVRVALFAWVASLPSITILANLITKRADEFHDNHLLADLVHYYFASLFWPIAGARHGRHDDIFLLLVLQALAFAVLGVHYLSKTSTAPITFRHLLPTAIIFTTNSLMTWAIGIVPA